MATATVSEINYYTSELLAQMARASKRGAKHLLVNSRDLGCCFGGFPAAGYLRLDCTKAMELEIHDGDEIILPSNSGSGLTVRYLLPRLL